MMPSPLDDNNSTAAATPNTAESTTTTTLNHDHPTSRGVPTALKPPPPDIVPLQTQLRLPTFPSLVVNILPATASTTSTTGCNNTAAVESMEDIAKEALRLTKETLKNEDDKMDQRQRQPQPLSAPPTTTAAAASPMNLPKKRLSKTAATVSQSSSNASSGSIGSLPRLNKFVRRLHDMLANEQDSGVVEWRRGLLVLHDTNRFAKTVLPRYFNSSNFKTFRRQMNFYGFIHVRSFSNTTATAASAAAAAANSATTTSSTTALWMNRGLAKTAESAGMDPQDISSVLLLKRVEATSPCGGGEQSSKKKRTAEGRRARKEEAIRAVEQDLGVNAKTLQLQQQLRHLQQQPPTPMVLEHYIHSAAGGDGRTNEEQQEPACAVTALLPTAVAPLDRPAASPEEASMGVATSDNDATNTTTGGSTGETTVKLPSSNVSAANLLLLLSRA